MRSTPVRIVSGILLSITLSVAIFATGMWWALLRGSSASSLATGVLKDSNVQFDLGKEFVNQLYASSDDSKKAIIDSKRKEIDAALLKVLADPRTQTKVAAIAQQFADALTKDQSSVSLDVRPILMDARAAINEVTGETILPSDVVDLKPIELGKGESNALPKLGNLRSAGVGSTIVVDLFALLFAFLVFKATTKRSLTLGIYAGVEGAIWLALTLAIPGVLSSAVEPGLARTMALAVESQLFAPIRVLSILLLIGGVVLIGRHVVLIKRKTVE